MAIDRFKPVKDYDIITYINDRSRVAQGVVVMDDMNSTTCKKGTTKLFQLDSQRWVSDGATSNNLIGLIGLYFFVKIVMFGSYFHKYFNIKNIIPRINTLNNIVIVLTVIYECIGKQVSIIQVLIYY